MISKELLNGAALLPEEIRKWVLKQNEVHGEIEEIRLRCGRPAEVVGWGHKKISAEKLIFTRNQMNLLMERATRSSLHSVTESLKHGFITSVNGIRIGICGTAVTDRGQITAIRDLSSVNIRIPHEKIGFADEFADKVIVGGRVRNTLIISPPGYGKTTLLRELIRTVSYRGYTCGIADERGELAAMHGGICGFDVGRSTDIISQAPKADAAMMLLRTMAPEVIAMDEISENGDMDAVRAINGCGVSIIASIHGRDIKDIKRRGEVCRLLHGNIFDLALVISMVNGERVITQESVER